MSITIELPAGPIADPIAFRREVGLAAYQQERLSFAKLAAFIGVSELDTLRLLQDRQIEVTYDADDLRDDLAFGGYVRAGVNV